MKTKTSVFDKEAAIRPLLTTSKGGFLNCQTRLRALVILCLLAALFLLALPASCQTLIYQWRGDYNARDYTGSAHASWVQPSGGNYDGASATPSYQTLGNSVYGESFHFGGGAHLVAGSPNQYSIDEAGDFTIAAWVRFATTNGSHTILSRDSGYGGQDKWIFGWNGEHGLTFHINTDGAGYAYLDAPFSPETNQWYHLAVTRIINYEYPECEDPYPVSSDFIYYVNGSSIWTNNTEWITLPAGNAPLRIGGSEDDWSMEGDLDQVNVYDGALNASGITSLTSLNFYANHIWYGDEDATDSVGGSMNGAWREPAIIEEEYVYDGAEATPAYCSGPVSGHSAFDFNGSTHVVAGNQYQSPFNSDGDFSIACWVKFASTNGSGYGIMSKDTIPGDANKWIFFWHATLGLQFHINTDEGGGTFISAPFSPNVDEWYHVAVARVINYSFNEGSQEWEPDSSDFNFYVNGQCIGTSSTGWITLPSIDAPTRIGGAEDGITMDGCMADVITTEAALSGAQIKAFYDSYSP
ncbi:MAG: LamG domain-containing protein [Verrucomicrobia bacterium]|nr:LamG domain-containing protein [Verrucomicrobiota bacterium]